jgi:formylglycine-generating enzyme required for sulfatase activity
MKTDKNHRLRRTAAALCVAAALPACTREFVVENGGQPPAGATEVMFTATTGLAAAETRTSGDGNFWLTTDEVGIFMYTSGETLSAASVSNGADNRRYRPQASAASSALNPASADQTIYFPAGGTVDFAAYYPWKASGTGAGKIDGYVYPIDLSDQSDPAAIDLLYALRTDRGSSLATVGLAFTHQLSKISLHVKKGSDISAVDFSAATATLVGMPSTGSFALTSAAITPGAVADFQAKKVETTATFDASFEALILPQAGAAGCKVVFAAGANTYEWEVPAGAAFEAGKNHIYALTIRATGAEEEGAMVAAIGALTPWADIDHSAATRGIGKVRITAGTFAMGSPTTEPGRDSYETQHMVTLTQDFCISKYETTNAQYAAFLNALGIAGVYDGGSERVGKYNSNILVREHEWGVYWDTENNRWKHQALFADYPVLAVTWYGADEFARWAGGSLPTEAQWEYACRAGNTTPFGLGDGNSLYADQANFIGTYPYALPGGQINDYLGDGHPHTSLGKTAPAGSYPPNAWGVYDMHGNVAEWCSDWFDYYYGSGSSSMTDPAGPASGSYRVVRGGGYNSYASNCRSAFRSNYASGYIGFRVAFPAEQ